MFFDADKTLLEEGLFEMKVLNPDQFSYSMYSVIAKKFKAPKEYQNECEEESQEEEEEEEENDDVLEEIKEEENVQNQ